MIFDLTKTATEYRIEKSLEEVNENHKANREIWEWEFTFPAVSTWEDTGISYHCKLTSVTMNSVVYDTEASWTITTSGDCFNTNTSVEQSPASITTITTECKIGPES